MTWTYNDLYQEEPPPLDPWYAWDPDPYPDDDYDEDMEDEDDD